MLTILWYAPAKFSDWSKDVRPFEPFYDTYLVKLKQDDEKQYD